MKGGGRSTCHQVWHRTVLSSGVANHHSVIVDTLLLDRTVGATCPLGTDTTVPYQGATSPLQSRERSRGLLLAQDGAIEGSWLSRWILKALCKGSHINNKSFPPLSLLFMACYSLQTRNQPSAAVFEEDNCQARWLTTSAVGLAYGHD